MLKPLLTNFALLLYSASTCHSAPINTLTVGLENLAAPVSDWDFNGIELSVSGLSFHTIGTFTFVSPRPLYTEIPLPNGYLFDYAMVTVTGIPGEEVPEPESGQYMTGGLVLLGVGVVARARRGGV